MGENKIQNCRNSSKIPIKKIPVTGNIDFPNTHIPDGSLFCFSTCTGTSTKCGGVKLVKWTKTLTSNPKYRKGTICKNRIRKQY